MLADLLTVRKSSVTIAMFVTFVLLLLASLESNMVPDNQFIGINTANKIILHTGWR